MDQPLRLPLITGVRRLHSRFLQGDRLRAQLVRGGIGSVALKLAHTGLTFVMVVILARLLEPEGYGVYAYVFALITLMAVPAQFGLPNLVVREVAASRVRGEWGLMRGVVRRANQAVAAMAVALIAVGGGVAWILADRFAEAQLTTFAWGLLLVPLLALGKLRGAALRGLHKVVQGQLPELALRPGLFVLLLLGAWLLLPSGVLTPSGAMALHALAAGMTLAVGAWLLWRARPAAMTAAPPAYRTRSWAMSALPLGLTAGMMLVTKQTDIVMLGFFVPAEDVGIYRVAVQVSMLVSFGLGAMNMVLAPQFSRLYAAGDMRRLQRVVTAGARAGLLVALPLVIIFVAFGAEILALAFGHEYASGATALAVLAIGQLINTAMGSVGVLLNMTGHEHHTARGVAVAAASNILLNLMLIPYFGILGAAAATATTFFIWNILLFYSAYKKLDLCSTIFYRIT